MKILMCRPDHYAIKYEINPWMSIKHQTHLATALAQWETLYQNIDDCGATILLVPQAPDCPDMTFTANAGLLLNDRIILSHFKFKERQLEAPHFESWFTQAGFHVVNRVNDQSPSAYFEGAGDALLAGDALFAGYGFRTNRSFYQTSGFFNADKLIYCELVNPYFYHIDTCFCPLNETLAIWHKDAFSPEAQKNMLKHIELIDVNTEEAKKFACNAVVIDQHVILPKGCPELTSTLESRGYQVRACDMTEYLKAGGACKCLTLRLD